MGLLAGLAPAHIRKLCDNPWDGGGGYTPREVGDMTLDQIFMRLTSAKRLRSRDGEPRRLSARPEVAVGLSGSDGLVAGRASDGTPIRGRVGGKSKTQLLKEAEAKKAAGGKRGKSRGN